ncbi:MAG: hypothetical protein ACTSVB_07895 [Candidatus Heimdallarchaeaceae archaeon]
MVIINVIMSIWLITAVVYLYFDFFYNVIIKSERRKEEEIFEVKKI